MAIAFEMTHHYRLMDEALKKHGMFGRIDFTDHILIAHSEKGAFQLFPQFQTHDGLYQSEITEKTKRFIGWRPYRTKSWSTATDKLLFKHLLKKYDIKTPDFSSSQKAELNDVIIKPSKSSFSDGIKGPISYSKDYTLDQESAEFYEQYIEGDIAKIWFWNHVPVAAEVLPQLMISGNGNSTLAELIQAHAKIINRQIDVNDFSGFLAFKGLSLNTVLEKEQECAIDFKYKSSLPTSYYTENIKIENGDFLGNYNLLKNLGEMIKEEAPSELESNVAYSIDGVLDKNKQLWVLEMNCNPYIHPYLYDAMIQSFVLQRVSSTAVSL